MLLQNIASLPVHYAYMGNLRKYFWENPDITLKMVIKGVTVNS